MRPPLPDCACCTMCCSTDMLSLAQRRPPAELCWGYQQIWVGGPRRCDRGRGACSPLLNWVFRTVCPLLEGRFLLSLFAMALEVFSASKPKTCLPVLPTYDSQHLVCSFYHCAAPCYVSLVLAFWDCCFSFLVLCPSKATRHAVINRSTTFSLGRWRRRQARPQQACVRSSKGGGEAAAARCLHQGKSAAPADLLCIPAVGMLPIPCFCSIVAPAQAQHVPKQQCHNRHACIPFPPSNPCRPQAAAVAAAAATRSSCPWVTVTPSACRTNGQTQGLVMSTAGMKQSTSSCRPCSTTTSPTLTMA